MNDDATTSGWIVTGFEDRTYRGKVEGHLGTRLLVRWNGNVKAYLFDPNFTVARFSTEAAAETEYWGRILGYIVCPWCSIEATDDPADLAPRGCCPRCDRLRIEYGCN